MNQETLNFNNNNSSLTPMMKQYIQIKSEYKDSLLFYRMGDFYEMFFEDAKEAVKILNITLTKRGKSNDQDIPMCGVPYHSCESYLIKLIENGIKVAICEQVESPEQAKKRGPKAIVRREVVRVITPGTILEDNILNSKQSNYLLSIAEYKANFAISWIDLSTGEFYTLRTNIENLSSDISRIDPKEILISEKLFYNEKIKKNLAQWHRLLTPQVNSFFDVNKNSSKIREFYNINAIETIGDIDHAQISSLGSILEYVSVTQKQDNIKINLPKFVNNSNFMQIDHATRKNLELVVSLSGERSTSLINFIDVTQTNVGGRLMHQYLSSPLKNSKVINQRLDLVELFLKSPTIIMKIREVLSNFPDIERSMSRLSLGYGGPRDLIAILQGMIVAEHLQNEVTYITNEGNVHFKNLSDNLSGFNEIINELSQALNSDVPTLARDGGFIKTGYDPRIDQLKDLYNNANNKVTELKNKYINDTKINNLKITRNNVLGYFIEVTPNQSSKITSDIFIHRQTLASAVRYTTVELKDLEQNIINAKEQILQYELEAFEHLTNLVINNSASLQLLAQSVAKIDLFSSLAFLAEKYGLVRPVVDNSNDFVVKNGWHPIVRNALKDSSHEDFIVNDCNLTEQDNIWLLTGPNMAGKSTFLRQNAIIAIMAQMGSFVPATAAKIGVIDRVFSRVGAADDLARGRSTFMVEMVETSIILNQATSNSFVILDEIGRGTSTHDGLSIAWSCLKYLHNKINVRTIFATHYHELNQLENTLERLSCHTIAIKEWEDSVIFLHKVIGGAANKSYGIHVATLAGIPKEVIRDAENILSSFSSKSEGKFQIDSTTHNNDNQESEIKRYLSDIDINNITPIEALNHLIKIKSFK